MATNEPVYSILYSILKRGCEPCASCMGLYDTGCKKTSLTFPCSQLDDKSVLYSNGGKREDDKERKK